jgi:hypothetical protein
MTVIGANLGSEGRWYFGNTLQVESDKGMKTKENGEARKEKSSQAKSSFTSMREIPSNRQEERKDSKSC